jgi:hypothetical protein
MKPNDGGRKWVKLWVGDWLDGTTRYQMNGAQRAFWIDLLAMAGRGRVGGIVCAGLDPGNKLIGYPIAKFQSLSPEPLDILTTFDLFERTGKIKVESEKNEFGLSLYVIHILSWDRYQSEYERTKKYRGSKNEPESDATEKLHGKSQRCYGKSTPRSRSKKEEVDSDSDSDSDLDSDSKRFDDDDDPRKKHAAVASPKLDPKFKDPTFKAWAESRILRSAQELGIPVKSPRAYIHRSLPEFSEDLKSEIITFLTERAEEFISNRFANKPGETVPVADTAQVLIDHITQHHLPCDQAMLDAAVRAAQEKNGWTLQPTEIPK